MRKELLLLLATGTAVAKLNVSMSAGGVFAVGGKRTFSLFQAMMDFHNHALKDSLGKGESDWEQLNHHGAFALVLKKDGKVLGSSHTVDASLDPLFLGGEEDGKKTRFVAKPVDADQSGGYGLLKIGVSYDFASYDSVNIFAHADVALPMGSIDYKATQDGQTVSFNQSMSMMYFAGIGCSYNFTDSIGVFAKFSGVMFAERFSKVKYEGGTKSQDLDYVVSNYKIGTHSNGSHYFDITDVDSPAPAPQAEAGDGPDKKTAAAGGGDPAPEAAATSALSGGASDTAVAYSGAIFSHSPVTDNAPAAATSATTTLSGGVSSTAVGSSDVLLSHLSVTEDTVNVPAAATSATTAPQAVKDLKDDVSTAVGSSDSAAKKPKDDAKDSKSVEINAENCKKSAKAFIDAFAADKSEASTSFSGFFAISLGLNYRFNSAWSAQLECTYIFGHDVNMAKDDKGIRYLVSAFTPQVGSPEDIAKKSADKGTFAHTVKDKFVVSIGVTYSVL